MKAVKQNDDACFAHLIREDWLEDCLTADNLINLFCNAGNPGPVSTLINKRYDINAKNDQGITPLLHLLYNVSPDEYKVLLLEVFLKNGADKDATATVNGQELSIVNYLKSEKCYQAFKTMLTKDK